MNKATRILKNMLPEDKSTVAAALGDIPENADSSKQAQYINDLLNYAEANNISMQNTMQKCGGSCLTKEVIDLAKNIYEKSSSIDQFLADMNDIGIGGKNLHTENGKIVAIYKNCYCDIPYKTQNLHMSYCQCSAGWFYHLFSEIFGKPVSVEIVDTITNGAKECTFVIEV
ncbi:MAG: hypothetical protein K2O34_05520 [Acetatifactor sp.]|nr:hypothetical protein [Acetatifactor sp.]